MKGLECHKEQPLEVGGLGGRRTMKGFSGGNNEAIGGLFERSFAHTVAAAGKVGCCKETWGWGTLYLRDSEKYPAEIGA